MFSVPTKHWGYVLIIAVLTIFTTSLFVSSRAQADGNGPRTGSKQFIVKLKSDSLKNKKQGQNDEAFASEVLSKNGKVKSVNKALKNPKAPNEYFVTEIDTANVLQTLEKLKKNPDIESTQLNYVYQPDVTPTDPRYVDQWAHPKTQAPVAWDSGTGDSSVVIAAIGTGVKWDHEDLKNNIWNNVDEIAANGIDDDMNGYVDDVRGWNFELNSSNPSDRETHETSVAGVAVATANNGVGIAGACWDCKLMPLRVVYESQDVADSIYYAVNNGAKVINMSFGNYDPYKYGADTIVETAINTAVNQGILVVATAGNDGISTKRFPGALENVVGVASTDKNDARAPFSNWGEWVDVAAPGAGILSTTPTGYGYVSGTSFSAPYVSGMAAALYARNPGLSINELRNILEYSSDKLLTDKPIPAGRIRSDKVVAGQRPEVYGLIKSPWENLMIDKGSSKDIFGTVLGGNYILEYKPETSTTWTQIASGSETTNGSLGSFSPPATDTYFNLRLTVSNGVLTDLHTILVSVGGGYVSGWPTNPGLGSLNSSPQIADVNGDGDLEIVTGTSSKNVAVLNHDGTMLTGWPKLMNTANQFGPTAVGDITGDGLPEVLATTLNTVAAGGEIMAWSADGTPVNGWPKAIGSTRGSVVLLNMDTDPALEVLVGESKVHAFQGDGTYVTGWPVTLSETNMQSSPAVGDVDNNGTTEIVLSSLTKVYVYNTTGILAATWTKDSGHGSPVLADLDGNNDLEILAQGSYMLRAYEHTGTVKWSKNIDISDAYNKLTVANVSGDKNPEVIYAATNGNNTDMYVLSSTGTTLPGWPKPATGKSSAEAVIGDIDGNGVLDVVLPTSAARLYAWNATGTLLSDFPKPIGSDVSMTAAAISDINSDGKTDLTVVSNDGTISIWDMASNYNRGMIPWPVARHDASNTGKASLTVDSILPSVSITSPVNGAIVPRSATTTINANASDNFGVTKVEFYVGTTLKCADATAPYSCAWAVGNTRGATYNLAAKAYDAYGNMQQHSITVKSSN